MIRKCVFDSGNWAPIRFKSQPSRGGVVEKITYRDLTLHQTRQAFEFNMEWRMVPPVAPPAKVLPVVKDVKIINVSGVRVVEGPAFQVTVLPASGHKCARCWNFMPEVSAYGIWENVCTRCHEALTEMHIAPPAAPEASL